MKSIAMTIAFGWMTAFATGCTPTIKVDTPDRPLEINMNVKIDHNIVVKVDKQLEKVMNTNDDIF